MRLKTLGCILSALLLSFPALATEDMAVKKADPKDQKEQKYCSENEGSLSFFDAVRTQIECNGDDASKQRFKEIDAERNRLQQDFDDRYEEEVRAVLPRKVGDAAPQPYTGLFPESIEIDGKVITYSRLSHAFLSSVLSDRFSASVIAQDRVILDDIKSRYPWLYPHLYRPDGHARVRVINKWNKPVRISVGLPDFTGSEPQGKHPAEQKYKYHLITGLGGIDEKSLEHEPKLKAVLKDFLPEIEKETNLDIRFLPRGNENANEYGNIRVLFFGDDRLKEGEVKQELHSVYLSYNGATAPVLFRGQIDLILADMVHFTPDSKYQVQGYLLPNHKNEIDMAFCYLYEGLDDALLEGLIKECIVRSLGFPSPLGYVPLPDHLTGKNLLSLWNDHKRWDRYPEVDPAPVFSEIDRIMLRTLYSPEITAEMPTMKIKKVLRGN